MKNAEYDRAIAESSIGDAHESGNDQYNNFVDKFKPKKTPKKTTDDCYTPPDIYDVVCEFVEKQYGVKRDNFVRPFYPGGDYENEPYPEGAVVVDNPPFSILSKILDFYTKSGVKFFLFAPGLRPAASFSRNICTIFCATDITYENGAKVNTCFVTNLDTSHAVIVSPELKDKLEAVGKRKKERKTYRTPKNLIGVKDFTRMARHGIPFELMNDECDYIHYLDCGYGLFSGGFLISDRAAERIRAAEQNRAEAKNEILVTLSDREKEIVDGLNQTQSEGGGTPQWNRIN